MHSEDDSSAFDMSPFTDSKPKKLKKLKRKEVICHYHAIIQHSLCEIECCMKREDPEAGADAIAALRRAQDAVELALPAGQAMEDRLKEYRNAIEQLGFIRKKK